MEWKEGSKVRVVACIRYDRNGRRKRERKKEEREKVKITVIAR